MPKKLHQVSEEEMEEMKQAIKKSRLTISAFCDALAEEFAVAGLEDESKPEKYRGWFKKGRLPERPLFDEMWKVLRQKDGFIASQQIKPFYLEGWFEPDQEESLKKLSKQISDELNKRDRIESDQDS